MTLLETRKSSEVNHDPIFAVTPRANVKNGAAKRLRFQHKC